MAASKKEGEEEEEEVLAEIVAIRFDSLECWFSKSKQTFIGTTKISCMAPNSPSHNFWTLTWTNTKYYPRENHFNYDLDNQAYLLFSFFSESLESSYHFKCG